MKAEQLRKSILQMAIQGKLVPQDPTDEPASVLLEKIRVEKQRLIKEGKIKKDKVDSIIFKGEDNRHYEKVGNTITLLPELDDIEIPSNWVLCRFSTIANIFTGNSINEQEKAKKYFGRLEGYNYIGTKDVAFDHSINYKNGVKIPYDTQFRIAHKGTPLLCVEGGSAGRKIGILNEDVCFGNKLCAFETYGIDSKYLYYFLQAPMFIDIFKASTTGIIGGVSVNVIKSLFFYLPPLAEQKRIVAKIEKYEPLIAEYDKLEQQKSKLDGEIFEKLKKSILQYAIQGKLVPQDENDEPASELLKRIRAEKKAKLGKKYVDSYIYKGDDNCYYEHIDGKAKDEAIEVPYDLPENWMWSRVQGISESYIGLTYKPSDVIKENGSIVLRSSNIQDGKLDLTDIVRVSSQITDKLRVVKNDIIICARNGSKKLVGKSALVDVDLPNLTFGAFMAICKTSLYAYAYIFLQSNLFFSQLEKVSGTTTINQLTQASFNSFLVPIPPLAEQQRIVDKINEIFSKL